jgi:hypothetical protein
MQIEAIYDQGRIELTQAIHLRHPRVRVLVEVPDEEVVAPSESSEMTAGGPADQDDLLTEIKQILGPLYRQRPSTSIEEDKQALVDCYAEKYLR